MAKEGDVSRNELRWECCHVISFINIVDTLWRKPIFSCAPVLPNVAFIARGKYELSTSCHSNSMVNCYIKKYSTHFQRPLETWRRIFYGIRFGIFLSRAHFLLEMSDNFVVFCSNTSANVRTNGNIELDGKQTISVLPPNRAMVTNSLNARIFTGSLFMENIINSFILNFSVARGVFIMQVLCGCDIRHKYMHGMIENAWQKKRSRLYPGNTHKQRHPVRKDRVET